MKKKIAKILISVIVVSIVFLVNVSPALAWLQTDTPTPVPPTATATATFQNLFNTATPRPIIDYTCSQGLPTSWGVRTPVPQWEQACGHCGYKIDQAATDSAIQHAGDPTSSFPTWEPLFPTATGGATATLAPTSQFRFAPQLGSPTSVPNGSNVDFHIPINTQYAGLVVGFVYTPTGNWNSSSARWAVRKGESTFTALQSFGVVSGDVYVALLNPNDDWNDLDLQISGTFASQVVLMMADNPGFDTQITISNNNPWFWQTGQDSGFITARMNKQGGVTATITILGYIWFDGNAVGGVPSNYCQSVDGILPGTAMPTSDPGQAVVTLPNPQVGASQCGGFAGVDVELPFTIWGNSQIVIPEIEVCLLPFTFGSISLFGGFLSINLDVILFLMGAVVIIRWFMRS